MDAASVAEQPSREAALAAYRRHEWAEACERFGELDRSGAILPDDLEAYADAAWWIGQPEQTLSLHERTFAARSAAGDRRAAAAMALLLFDDNRRKGALTVASAWLGRAEKLLENDTDSAEYGKLRLRRAMVAGLDNMDALTAIAESKAALKIGRRFRDRDVEAMALMAHGAVLIATGRMREGMALIDQATVAAVSGELSLMTTGMVYCSTISACRDLADYGRASEWTEAAIRWCERQSVSGFPGICRVHRAEVLELRGALAKAEQEARLAHDELMRFDIKQMLGESVYEIGSIRLRMGDVPAAEEAFRQAHELGRVPEPGMSLIRLGEGKAAAANASLRRALAEVRSRPVRARLLPVQAEAAIAAGDLEAARAALDELAEIADAFGTTALLATAAHVRGALALAEGDGEGARQSLANALGLWQRIEAPYETSQTRVLLASAERASGDDEAARLELAAAKATFERIGARRDARLVAAQLGEDATDAPTSAGADAARVTRTFLFTDIVDSTKLIGVIGDDAWRDLIRWHDDAIRAVIAAHGGEEIRSQGDGFVVAFESAARAIDAAIAIQRRLAEHRKAHGFAPAVRVGVHETTATQRGLDYAGVGVHEAARIGALATAGEILVSRATLDASGRNPATGAPRLVELKGIAAPIEIVPVNWR